MKNTNAKLISLILIVFIFVALIPFQTTGSVYASDQQIQLSKEELEKLNKRNGTAYDECMVISADIYSNEEQAVLRDTKWQLAKENGVWRVVEYSTSEGEK